MGFECMPGAEGVGGHLGGNYPLDTLDRGLRIASSRENQPRLGMGIYEQNIVGGIGSNITKVQKVPADQGRQLIDEWVEGLGPYITDINPVRPDNPITSLSKDQRRLGGIVIQTTTNSRVLHPSIRVQDAGVQSKGGNISRMETRNVGASVNQKFDVPSQGGSRQRKKGRHIGCGRAWSWQGSVIPVDHQATAGRMMETGSLDRYSRAAR